MKDKLATYISTVYTFTFYIMYFLSIIGIISDVIYYGNNGMIGSAIILVFFFWLMAAIRAIIPTILWGTAGMLLGLVPFMIYTHIKEGKKHDL